MNNLRRIFVELCPNSNTVKGTGSLILSDLPCKDGKCPIYNGAIEINFPMKYKFTDINVFVPLSCLFSFAGSLRK